MDNNTSPYRDDRTNELNDSEELKQIAIAYAKLDYRLKIIHALLPDPSLDNLNLFNRPCINHEIKEKFREMQNDIAEFFANKEK